MCLVADTTYTHWSSTDTEEYVRHLGPRVRVHLRRQRGAADGPRPQLTARWFGASAQAAGTTGVHATVAFTNAGSPLGAASAAPASADDFEANMDPHTGVIANAYWTAGGKSLGPLGGVPSGATGLVFTTSPGASPGPPIVRPKAATGFHVSWDTSGVITAASWVSVGRLLATIPLASGQKAIAFTNA